MLAYSLDESITDVALLRLMFDQSKMSRNVQGCKHDPYSSKYYLWSKDFLGVETIVYGRSKNMKTFLLFKFRLISNFLKKLPGFLEKLY